MLTDMNLVQVLSKLSDSRRAQGRRVSQESALAMVILSYMCGFFSYRKIATFARAHSELLSKELGLKHGIPSYITFREILIHTNERELIAAFNQWAADFVGLSAGEWVSLDGKSLRSTVSDYNTSSQDFQSVVSVFVQNTGLVLAVDAYRNKKVSEIEVVRGLLSSLKDQNVHIVLDALHIKKNGESDCGERQPLHDSGQGKSTDSASGH
jgi:hypothetical protein